jgi:hypothetical protein
LLDVDNAKYITAAGIRKRNITLGLFITSWF